MVMWLWGGGGGGVKERERTLGENTTTSGLSKFYHYECKKVTRVTSVCCIMIFLVKSGVLRSFIEWGGMLAAMFLKIMPRCRF